MPFQFFDPLNYPTNSSDALKRVIQNRNPNGNDFKNFNMGDEWLDSVTQQWWKLCGYSSTTGAVWKPMTASTIVTNWTWVEIGSDAIGMVSTGYITNKAGTAALVTLPPLSNVGDMFGVLGKNPTGWQITQGIGQYIIMGQGNVSTVGIGGSVNSTDTPDSLILVCTIANTAWTRIFGTGNLTIT